MDGEFDYDSLLEPGFHTLTFDQLKEICILPFTLSRTREGIMNCLEEVVNRLQLSGISGLLWVDGSFVTAKINPNDVDVLLEFDASQFDNGSTSEIETLNWFASNLKSTHLCDSYCLLVYPEGHPLRQTYIARKSYWEHQFGYGRQNERKGIALVEI